MEYMLGANYWGRTWGTEMWLHYDGDEIRREFKQLSECGVKFLRVFPNWRDFQPVDRAYGWQGAHGEYMNSRTGETVCDDGVDMDRIEDFRDFCHAAEEYGIGFVVGIVTGWMSGRLFTPPLLNGKNIITDHEALMWMRRYINRFVKELKNEKAIKVWDLGNECNCLGSISSSFDAYNWTATVVDAIRIHDSERPISSGMHGLRVTGDTFWHIEDQGELCDILTTHPYPSPTVGGDKEPYTRLRMTYLPTAQSLYYAGVSGKQAYIQESGTFSQSIGSNRMAADFMRIQILSSLVNGLCGYQWWCAWEQDHLNFPPYTWAMIERELGLFDKNNNPKPVASVMKNMSDLLDTLPNPFPKRKADGVCVLSRGQKHQDVAISSLIFGKQAGIDLDVAYSDNGEIPNTSLYFMPSITGWQIIYKKTWNTLLERVKNGATLCITFDGGQITEFPEVVGAESMGFSQANHSFSLDGKHISYIGKEILLSPTTAEVLCENEEGTPVFLKNKYGDGYVYFVNFAPESIAFNTPDGFIKHPYYTLYRCVAKEIIENKPLITDDANLGITVNPESDDTLLVTVLNYSDKSISPNLKIADGYRIEKILYGSLENVPACDGVILRMSLKEKI